MLRGRAWYRSHYFFYSKRVHGVALLIHGNKLTSVFRLNGVDENSAT